MSHARGFASCRWMAGAPLLPASLVSALLLPACVVDTGVGVRLEMESSSVEPAKITLRVFAGDCPGRPEALVLDEAGGWVIVTEQTFVPGSAGPIGELDPGRYCFAALARDTDCRPLAYGERAVEIGRDAGVVIRMAALSWTAAPCPGGGACAAGECTEAPPAGCAPDTCITGTGSTGDCCAGRCVDLASDPGHCGSCGAACGPTERCVASRCGGATSCEGVDVSTSRVHCGECDHACPSDLACVTGLCRPVPRPSRAAVEVDSRLASPGARTDLMVGIAWVNACDMGTTGPGRPAWLASGPTAPLEGAADGALSASLYLEDTAGPGDIGSCSDPAGLRVAFGHIAVFQDTDGNRTLDAREHDDPRELGLAAEAVIFSEMAVGRSLPSELARLFPEGLLAGTAVYRVEGGAFYPASGDAEGSIRIRIAGACLADTDGGSADPACLADQTGPFRP